MNEFEAARAVSNPLRVKLLTQMGRKVSSPSELADALELPLANVSYHMRLLRKLGAITLDRTEPRRGATEHFYKATHTIKLQLKEIK